MIYKLIRPYSFLFFYLCMPSDIFYFLQSDWLQQRAAFYDISTVVQKSYFFSNKPRSEDNFQTQNATQKVKKSTLSILKIVTYSELTSANLVPSPKCTFLRPNCEKNKYKHRKNTAWPVLHVLIQMLHIYSAILRKYT
jgi:hypothetical protein